LFRQYAQKCAARVALAALRAVRQTLKVRALGASRRKAEWPPRTFAR
jgi:hypothetical protein